MKFVARLVWVLLFSLLAVSALAGPAFEEPGEEALNDAVTTPEEFFGFPLGADKKLARWDRIVEYYRLLERESDRLKVIDLGPSTEGHPYLLAIISSPENLARLERLRQVNLKIQDPATPESELEELLAEGRAVVSQSFGLHSSEVAGAQTAPDFTYDLLARDDDATLRILDQTIQLLFPCFNPDGQIMTTDWYRETVGTEYEGVGLPWLYHKYVGHDNNRDGDFMNMVEAVYTGKVLYRDWKPQAYVDHHQMGSYGARIYVPPYSEPIRPYADPLIWRELSWYGSHIAYKLEEKGVKGVLNAAQYPGWGHFGWHWITPFHNITGMLTESASASYATPLYIHPDQLRGGARGMPEYEPQSTMPSPWPGGWWRVSDIVRQQKIAAYAIMDMAARHRETVLRNAYLKARRQTERGAEGSPKGYVIPARQHDPLTAVKMVNTLRMSDIHVQRAEGPLTVGKTAYQPGSYVVPMAQPKMGLVRNLLGRTFYPDNEWTRARDGSPLRPYDTSTHTMAEFMGVQVDAAEQPVEGELALLSEDVPLSGSVDAQAPWLLDGRLNASFKAVNLLIDQGIEVERAHQAGDSVRIGDFVVSGGSADVLGPIADETGVHFVHLEGRPGQGVRPLKRLRTGMYHRYRGGNMDEGWTRFLLEQFAFPYTSLKDDEIKAGDLASTYDVIILPHDSAAMITGEEPPSPRRRRRQEYPPEYMTGIGKEGVEALKAFVEEGGRLVTLGQAAELALEKFDLNVRGALEGLSSREFFCPGSTLRVRFDNTNPLAYGMPSQGLVLFWQGPAFEITPSRHNDRYSPVATYAKKDILQSGWLIGEEHIAEKAGMVAARHGQGEVVLIGFRTQHRAQTHGTFKLLFNTMLR
ncbi:MAG TPA: M14 metallopeptidase family protein [Acidobacteriota bacterium]|nr:M14 metallopeptidase family protein [Acidobacteriota bacterium]